MNTNNSPMSPNPISQGFNNEKLQYEDSFEKRDHDNLVEDYMTRCGYSRREAELAAAQTEEGDIIFSINSL